MGTKKQIDSRNKVICPNCQGSGEKVTRSNHSSIFKTRPCYTCIGKGEITKEESKEFLKNNS